MSPLINHLYHPRRRPSTPPPPPSVSSVQEVSRPNHIRRNSWPPALSLLHLDHFPSSLPKIHSPSLLTNVLHKNHNSQVASSKSKDGTSRSFQEDLDEDPFAHFLSPVTDDELEEELLAFSAGIVSSPTKSPSASLRGHQSEINASAKGWRVRRALRGRWERYVERHHPHFQEQLQQHQRRRQQEIDDEEYRQENGEPHEFVMPSPSSSEHDEGYESAWSSSPPDMRPLLDREGSSSPVSEPEYYTLSSGKRVKLESRTPNRQLLSRSHSYPDKVAVVPDIIVTEAMELALGDEIHAPDRTPSPTLGHAATIMSANEKLRRRNKGAGSKKRRNGGGRMPIIRRHSWVEPGWGMYPLIEEGEE